MLDILKDAIRKVSADYAELHFEVWDNTRIVYSNENVEAVSTAQTSSGNARVLNNGGWGFASFNGTEFARHAGSALYNANLVGKSSGGHKSSVRLLGRQVQDTVKTSFQVDPASYSLAQKNELVRGYNNLLKHPGIASTRVTYSDWKAEKYFVNTEGSAIRQTRVFTGVSCGAMSKDGTTIQNAFDSVGQYGGMELVLGRDEKVEAVKKRALDLLAAKKVDAGQYRVILDPILAGVFVHEAFGHLSESDFLYENPRMLEVMRLGREFGPEFLNIVDDGTIPGLAGYTPYDDEGVPGKRNYLIKNGKLNARLHSRETAVKMGEGLTGNARAVNPAFQPIVRMTNTFIENGDKTPEELFSMLDDGIYAVEALGGMTNLEMFTFSAALAYRVRGGKVREMLRDVTLSGNVFATLKNVRAVGNDLRHQGGLGGCGKGGQGGLPVGTGSPHIVIDNVLIGGV